MVQGPRQREILARQLGRYAEEGNLILIKADFRGFTDMIERWRVRYPATPGAGPVVEDTVREWFEQALLETVLGVRSLAGS